MERLTHKYIRKNYDISKESIEVEDRRVLGTVDVEFPDGTKISELCNILSERLKDYPTDAFIMSFPYGYDGAETIEVFQTYNRKESEGETIGRLIKDISTQRKIQKKYDKALEIVNNGGSQK